MHGSFVNFTTYVNRFAYAGQPGFNIPILTVFGSKDTKYMVAAFIREFFKYGVSKAAIQGC